MNQNIPVSSFTTNDNKAPLKPNVNIQCNTICNVIQSVNSPSIVGVCLPLLWFYNSIKIQSNLLWEWSVAMLCCVLLCVVLCCNVVQLLIYRGSWLGTLMRQKPRHTCYGCSVITMYNVFVMCYWCTNKCNDIVYVTYYQQPDKL